MKRLIYSFLFFVLAFILGFGSAFAQQACLPKPEKAYYHSLLDSAGSNIQDTVVWINFENSSSNPEEVRPPFYQQFAPLDVLHDVPGGEYDNKPEDGWEVLHHDFGFTPNSIAS